MPALISESIPAFDPVDMSAIKAALRITDTADDVLLTALTSAAVAHVETSMSTRLSERNITYAFDCLSDALELPVMPVSAVVSVTYLDDAGVRQTLSAPLYRLMPTGSFPQVLRVTNASYPSHRHEPGSVLVTVKAGYDDADLIPAPLKQAVVVMVCDAFRNPDRPLQATQNVAWLLQPLRRGEYRL